MATLNNISFYRGEAVQLTWTMIPTTDITGWTIVFTCRNNANDSTYLFQLPASLVTPATGVFAVTLTHAQTVLLLGNYAYDIQRTDPSSEANLSIGTISVTQEVLYP